VFGLSTYACLEVAAAVEKLLVVEVCGALQDFEIPVGVMIARAGEGE